MSISTASTDPLELDELGLDIVLGDGVLIVEWPERAGAGAWPRGAPACRFDIRRRRRARA